MCVTTFGNDLQNTWAGVSTKEMKKSCPTPIAVYIAWFFRDGILYSPRPGGITFGAVSFFEFFVLHTIGDEGGRPPQGRGLNNKNDFFQQRKV